MNRILVTGCLGFIGSYFVKYVLNNFKDVEVVGLNRNSNQKNIKRIEKVLNNPKFTLHYGDFSRDPLADAFKDVDTVIHFGAKTFVDYSIRDPLPFINSNIVGTYRLLEEARKTRSVELFFQISCYDEKTKALTKNGFKKYNELKEGDIILSINPETLAIEEKPIEKIIIQDYEGEMYFIKNRRINFLITPNHRVYLKKNNKKKLFFDEIQNIYNSNLTHINLPHGKWYGKSIDFIPILGVGNVNMKKLFYISGIFIGDGCCCYQKKEVETKSGLNKEDYLKQKDKNGRFLKIKNKTSYKSICNSWRMFIYIPESDSCRKKVESILTDFGIKWYSSKRKNDECIYFSSKNWFKYFKQFGKHAKNKNIPSWMLKYNKEILEELYNGLIDSDGYKGENNHSYTTVSKKLCCDFCELSIKIGYFPSVYNKYSEDYIDNRKISGHSFFITNGKKKTPKNFMKKHISKKHYKGKVWCLKIKDNKNFLVERNGKIDFCGNTDEVYGSILEGKYKEDSRPNPTNPYSASKMGADCLVISYFNTYGLNSIITRTENNYGEFQAREKVFPVFIRKAVTGESLPVYGDGLHRRMWLYVEDHCSAIIHLINKGKRGEIYHVAGEEELTNIELAKKILKLCGRPGHQFKLVPDFDIRPGHDRRYALDCEKIKKTGWESKWSIEDGFKKTVNWYLNNLWWISLQN